jgi:phosphoglycolate phosphatase
VPRYRLAVFDSDGTLSDTLPWMRGVYNEVATSLDLRNFSPEEFERHRDLHGAELLEAAGVPLWKLPRLMSEFRRRMAEHDGSLHVFEGIPEALRRLDASGLHLAVVSSNSRANVERILGPDLSALFGHFDCGAALFGKASKIRATVRHFRVAPGESIYLGDELRDAEAARKAGVGFGAVAWGQHTLATLQGAAPDRVFQTVPDLLGLLD